MIIEIILIVLGILTLVLGIGNFIVGAYIWGTLFVIGGLWSISLGIIYLIQLRKQKKQSKKESEINIDEVLDDNVVMNDLTEEEIIESLEKEEQLSELNNETQEFEKAVTFTNEVIPTPNVESDDLEKLDKDSQITTEIDDIDRNVEIIQDMADTVSEEE